MKIKTEYLDRAKYIALRSPQVKFRVGAILVKNNKILSDGVNHSSHMHYSSTLSMHAEAHCLARAHKANLDGAVIYVAVIKHNGNIVLGKPCIVCATLLAAAGVTHAIYTIDNNNFGVANLQTETSWYRSANGQGVK